MSRRSPPNEALESLRAKTKVVADSEQFHARTPSDDAWCGAKPFGKPWEVISLTSAEASDKLSPCFACFDISIVADIVQERLKYE